MKRKMTRGNSTLEFAFVLLLLVPMLIGTTVIDAAAKISSWGFVITPDMLTQLAKDVGEKNDLAPVQPEKVKQLQALWDAWNAGNEPPRWIDTRWNGDGAKPKKQAGKKKAK